MYTEYIEYPALRAHLWLHHGPSGIRKRPRRQPWPTPFSETSQRSSGTIRQTASLCLPCGAAGSFLASLSFSLSLSLALAPLMFLFFCVFPVS